VRQVHLNPKLLRHIDHDVVSIKSCLDVENVDLAASRDILAVPTQVEPAAIRCDLYLVPGFLAIVAYCFHCNASPSDKRCSTDPLINLLEAHRNPHIRWLFCCGLCGCEGGLVHPIGTQPIKVEALMIKRMVVRVSICCTYRPSVVVPSIGN